MTTPIFNLREALDQKQQRGLDWREASFSKSNHEIVLNERVDPIICVKTPSRSFNDFHRTKLEAARMRFPRSHIISPTLSKTVQSKKNDATRNLNRLDRTAKKTAARHSREHSTLGTWPI